MTLRLGVRRWHLANRERRALHSIGRTAGEFERLGVLRARELSALLASDRSASEWGDAEPRLSAFGISESAGGVNPGDRRALFSLLRTLRVKSVLEVGTHVGASTVSTVVALALNRRLDGGAPPTLTTVDIADVNDERGGGWVRCGSKYSPRQMVAAMGAEGWVRFVKAPSLEFLAGNDEPFDFVFLDGDHGAATVYQEVPLALRSLKPGGFILLHDFFPRGEALWSNGIVLPGPWLAMERLRSEGAPIEVLPFAELPWATKQGSRVSSLALLTGHSPTTDPIDPAGERSGRIPSQGGGRQPVEPEIDPARPPGP